jgi:hypothetical protein
LIQALAIDPSGKIRPKRDFSNWLNSLISNTVSSSLNSAFASVPTYYIGYGHNNNNNNLGFIPSTGNNLWGISINSIPVQFSQPISVTSVPIKLPLSNFLASNNNNIIGFSSLFNQGGLTGGLNQITSWYVDKNNNIQGFSYNSESNNNINSNNIIGLSSNSELNSIILKKIKTRGPLLIDSSNNNNNNNNTFILGVDSNVLQNSNLGPNSNDTNSNNSNNNNLIILQTSK